MTFAEWKAYWKKIDWTRKWFAVFILLRPIVDNFYKIKEYSSFLSPIYIMGVLTPLLAVSAMLSMKNKNSGSPADELFRFWGILILINCLVILASFYSLDTMGNCIKYLTPPVVFFYLRKAVRNKEDLHFILTTFLYSCIFPFSMMFFEVLVHPITPEYASAGRGGGVRIRGEYADSMNYATFLVGSFLCMGYFFLENIYNKERRKRSKNAVMKLSIWFLVCLVAAISLRHVSTWAVFLTLITLLLFFNSQNLKGIVFGLFIAAIILPFFARTIYETQIYPLIAKEFNVINGDQDVQYAFNGRVSRWERYFEVWGRMPELSHYLGVSFSGFRQAPVMVGGGMHNDYIRNLFLTGIVGVVLYFLFFLFVLYRRKFMKIPEQFLVMGSVAIVLLYSVSTLPTIYPGLFCLVYPIYAFALLPAKQAYGIKVKRRTMVMPTDLTPAT
jgi:O-antigen ligase